MIYFCHIPKTSGTSVVHSVSNAFSDTLRIPEWFEVYDPAQVANSNREGFEKFLELSVKEYDFIYGHLGSAFSSRNYSDKVDTFTLIREPVDRLISIYNWINRDVSESLWEKERKFELIPFLRNEHKTFYPSFSHTNNSQSAYIISDYCWYLIDQNIFISINPINISFEELLQIIKKRKITISTIDNRKYLLDELEICLNKIKQTNIKLDKNLKENINIIGQKRITLENIYSSLSKEDLDKIKQFNQLDFQLYDYVKNHEEKTGRPLNHKDILF
jgi:hypothetical protein